MKKRIALAATLLTSSVQAHQSTAQGADHALEHGLLFGLLGVMAYFAVKTLSKARLSPLEMDRKK